VKYQPTCWFCCPNNSITTVFRAEATATSGGSHNDEKLMLPRCVSISTPCENYLQMLGTTGKSGKPRRAQGPGLVIHNGWSPFLKWMVHGYEVKFQICWTLEWPMFLHTHHDV
jgi:hypothetical protein